MKRQRYFTGFAISWETSQHPYLPYQRWTNAPWSSGPGMDPPKTFFLIASPDAPYGVAPGPVFSCNLPYTFPAFEVSDDLHTCLKKGLWIFADHSVDLPICVHGSASPVRWIHTLVPYREVFVASLPYGLPTSSSISLRSPTPPPGGSTSPGTVHPQFDSFTHGVYTMRRSRGP